MSKSIIKYSVVLGISTALLSLIVGSEAKDSPFSHVAGMEETQVAIDTPKTPDLKYPYAISYRTKQDCAKAGEEIAELKSKMSEDEGK
ncbi:MAG TPA: hypothetical protein VLB84_14915 [Bacteroidia bacterium]|nr:hypothetical protein [Bacteroidia bacterium]